MKLRLIYTPEGEDSQEFDFDPDTVFSLEAEALEDVGGDSWDSYAEWIDKVGSGNIRARRALLWILLRRSNPKLRFEDLVFRINEFDVLGVEEDPESEGKDEADDDSTDTT